MPDNDTIEHGTRKGHDQHKATGTKPCISCYSAEADYHQAWRVRNRISNLSIPLDSVRRILAGDDPASVLAETYGPLTLDAVRQYGQVPRG